MRSQLAAGKTALEAAGASVVAVGGFAGGAGRPAHAAVNRTAAVQIARRPGWTMVVSLVVRQMIT